LMREVLPLVDGLEVYTRRHNADQVARYEELARQRRLWMTVGTDFHGFNGDAYAAPRAVVDARYLETLGSRIEWPVVAQAV
jgi:predicted metal-dependent phosphoesterase TrpH